MSRKSPSLNGLDVFVSDTPKRTRTAMNTLRIVRYTYEDNTQDYLVFLNGKCTCQLNYAPETQALVKMGDKLGSFDGFAKYYKTNPDKFDTIMVSKSPDL